MDLLDFPLLAMTVGDRWCLGIGDPSLGGWLTVAAYLIASVLCWRCAVKAAGRDGGARVVWCLLAALLLVMGVNKQLDLQSWVTQVGSDTVRAHGWPKRVVQMWFIAGVAVAGPAVLGLALWLARRSLRQLALALVGVLFLVCFVMVRAVSFHAIDHMLGTRFAGAKLNWILELCGIGCVALCAWLNLRRRAVYSEKTVCAAPGGRLSA